jgi:hypothetical protein
MIDMSDGREQLREAIEAWKKNGAPNEKSLAAFGLRIVEAEAAALAHDRPSGSVDYHEPGSIAEHFRGVADRPSGSGLREALYQWCHGPHAALAAEDPQMLDDCDKAADELLTVVTAALHDRPSGNEHPDCLMQCVCYDRGWDAAYERYNG